MPQRRERWQLSCDVIVVVGARGCENTSGRLSDAMIAVHRGCVCVELRASRVMINSITAHHHPPHTIIYTFRAEPRTVVREKSSSLLLHFRCWRSSFGKETFCAPLKGGHSRWLKLLLVQPTNPCAYLCFLPSYCHYLLPTWNQIHKINN